MQGNNPVRWVSHLPVRTISAQSLSNKSRWPRNVRESKDNDESFCCFSSRLKETNRCESQPALPVLRTEWGMSMHCHPRLVSYRGLVRNPPGVAFLSTFYPFTAVFQYAAQLVLNPAGQTQDIQPGGCETESKHFFFGFGFGLWYNMHRELVGSTAVRSEGRVCMFYSFQHGVSTVLLFTPTVHDMHF